MAGQQYVADAKPTNFAQKVALFIAHAGAVISVIMVSSWAKGTELGYMGGLDWDDKNLVFNYHPVLMISAFVLASTEALLAYRSWPLTKQVNKALHLALQTIAVILLSVGLRAVFKNHQETDKPDLWSFHSWLGILVSAAFCLNYLFAVLTYALPLAPQPFRAKMLPYHIFLGLSIYIAGIFTAQTGIVEKAAFMAKQCTFKYSGGGIHYNKLAQGCELGNWLGLVILVTGAAALFAVSPAGGALGSGRSKAEGSLLGNPVTGDN